MIRRARRAAPAFLLLAGLVAGCAANNGLPSASASVTPSPFRDCEGLTGGTSQLPDLRLSCFTGGQPVRLADVRGPAVINIWATWCGPCREELPAMQRLADRAGGKLRVIGVDTGDSRAAAASFGTDVKVTLPTLYDPDRALVGALGRTALPVTIFLDASGKRFVYNQLPPNDVQLASLVREHTGVAVNG